MCGSMVDIQSPAAEIKRGNEEEERRKKETGWKYIWSALLHRATINKTIKKMDNDQYLVCIPRLTLLNDDWDSKLTMLGGRLFHTLIMRSLKMFSHIIIRQWLTHSLYGFPRVVSLQALEDCTIDLRVYCIYGSHYSPIRACPLRSALCGVNGRWHATGWWQRIQNISYVNQYTVVGSLYPTHASSRWISE